MANSVDLQQAPTIQLEDALHPTQITLYRDSTALFFEKLTDIKNCGVFILVDKVLTNHDVNAKTALVILDILRCIKHSSLIVHPSSEDNPKAFALKMLSTAEAIVATSGNTSSALYTSALVLTEYVHEINDEGQPHDNLEFYWQDFLLHFYREKLYSHLTT
ncbi:MAG: hypothetical protein WCF65_05750 [Parachlamydiaceae bacterium]